MNPLSRAYRSFRALTYTMSWGLVYQDALNVVDTIDNVRHLFGWNRSTCVQHVEYFVVRAKTSDGDMDRALFDAMSTYRPHHVDELFT